MPVHEPVLLAEVVQLLAPEEGARILDLTVGAGGHASSLRERAGASGLLVGVDRDAEVLEIARRRLAATPGARVELIAGSFGALAELRARLPSSAYDCVLLDLGVSSWQLDLPERGFSFRRDGPLDMRMDRGSELTAERLVNECSVEELRRIVAEFGEERYAARVAAAIVEARRSRRLDSTARLAAIVRAALPPQPAQRIDPATRTFQALRIAVNRELEALRDFLGRFELVLARGGRLAVISYHSLEDRQVKNAFRERAREGDYEPLTRRCLTPAEAEIERNPRSRSARLRGLRRLREEERR
ncbi:MAG: 16S rRNA (cytosine(1402)-N(4))-methyltransferase RsmH [Planctomycetes bacterium]|nr:16S rRNA (cytosine(1402)-N(4))-methyltransferase RsmH [Planctomycetota bacterium]